MNKCEPSELMSARNIILSSDFNAQLRTVSKTHQSRRRPARCRNVTVFAQALSAFMFKSGILRPSIACTAPATPASAEKQPRVSFRARALGVFTETSET
jgi:hypothetical protein